ncbi:MAG: twin-arginine translocation signal domain-containing protein, partial [Myxococcales bacterium]|nr:twin-arginine translocation signal domain-containing protein [Myxococcales bacterium]
MQRRNFLGGVAAGLGLLAVPRDSRAEAAQQRFLLIVFAQGAWDVTYALDPKQAPGCDVPAGKVTSYGHGIKVLTDPSR